MSETNTPRMHGTTFNAFVVAFVIFLAGLLYVYGTSLSGDGPHLTESVRGSVIIDSRDVK